MNLPLIAILFLTDLFWYYFFALSFVEILKPLGSRFILDGVARIFL